MLDLTADATLKVTPDELFADLSAIDTSTSAVIAQRRVNTLMAGAATAAGKEPGIHSSFQDYSVSVSDPSRVSLRDIGQ